MVKKKSTELESEEVLEPVVDPEPEPKPEPEPESEPQPVSTKIELYRRKPNV